MKKISSYLNKKKNKKNLGVIIDVEKEKMLKGNYNIKNKNKEESKVIFLEYISLAKIMALL